MASWLWLALGFACAGLGGELFIRGAVGLAHWARVGPGIIGATVAAFATSGAEISVAVSSASAGKPEISVGNALGSNVSNIALILGVGLLVSAMHASRGVVNRDFPAAALAPIVLILFAWDGSISRVDAVMMLGLFAGWLTAVSIEARKQRSEVVETLGEVSHFRVVAWLVIGLALLAVAGDAIVVGAVGVGKVLGLDTFFVGATIVAIGTTIPELATMIIAKLKGHDEVGLGAVVGSNIFNTLFVVPIAGLIHPIAVSLPDIGFAVMAGLVVLGCAFPMRSGLIPRYRGLVLVAMYAVYLSFIFQSSGN